MVSGSERLLWVWTVDLSRSLRLLRYISRLGIRWESGRCGSGKMTHRTRLRKGVRVGCEEISEDSAGSTGAGDGGLGGLGGGAPMAVRMSPCWLRADFLVFFISGAASPGIPSPFLFSPLSIFPRTAKLRRSNSARSVLPSAIASPS